MRAERVVRIGGVGSLQVPYGFQQKIAKGSEAHQQTAGGKSSPSSSMRKKCTGRSFLISVLDGLPN